MDKNDVLNFLTNLADFLEESFDARHITRSNAIIVNNDMIKMRKIAIDNINIEHTIQSLSNLMMTEFNIDINVNTWNLDMLIYYVNKFNVLR